MFASFDMKKYELKGSAVTMEFSLKFPDNFPIFSHSPFQQGFQMAGVRVFVSFLFAEVKDGMKGSDAQFEII